MWNAELIGWRREPERRFESGTAIPHSEFRIPH